MFPSHTYITGDIQTTYCPEKDLFYICEEGPYLVLFCSSMVENPIKRLIVGHFPHQAELFCEGVKAWGRLSDHCISAYCLSASQIRTIAENTILGWRIATLPNIVFPTKFPHKDKAPKYDTGLFICPFDCDVSYHCAILSQHRQRGLILLESRTLDRIGCTTMDVTCTSD